jgi:uncharacterized protein YndB with AHSA1/START domain
MSAENTPVEAPSNRQILQERVFNAPRELVFRAWTDPEHLRQWWGPKGFTNTFHEFDFRPGGVWSFVMHGPDGTNFPNKSIFVEIVKPDRIVLDHVVNPKFRLTATFVDLGSDKTKLTWHMLFETIAAYDSVKKFAIEGAIQNLDRLQAHLTQMI